MGGNSMVKHFKRPLSILLAVMMVIGIFAALPITASAVTYTVTYDPNDGEGIEQIVNYDDYCYVKSVSSFNYFDGPPGSSFRSWNTKADGTGTRYYAMSTLSEYNGTLYAQWGQYDSVNEILYDPWYVTTSLPTTAGKYVLRNDVTLTSAWEVPAGTTYLRLNGHSITLSGSSDCVIHICNDGSVLNLYDEDGDTGIITGGNNNSLNAKDGGGVAVSAAATFNMYGGKIYNNTAQSGGGGVAVSNPSAVFNMYGGIIDSNRSLGAGAGGVRVYRGTFNMSGGTISNNTARDNGGGVNVDGGYGQAFNMSGGSITGNTAQHYGGGGVGIDDGGTFTMSGGSITANTAASNDNFRYGGGVMVNDSATFRASGSAVVSGNHCGSSNNDVYLANGRVINVNGAFAADANIGVTKHNNSNGIFTSGYATYNSGRNPANDFFSNNSSYAVALNGSEAELRQYNITWKNYDNSTVKTTYCAPGATPSFSGTLPVKHSDSSHGYVFAGWTPALGAATSDTTYTATYNTVAKHEHDGINFTYWNSTNSLPTAAGNYVLNADVTISSTWNVPTGTTSLCLNGHTIRKTSVGGVIKNTNADTTLSIYDCGSTGTITGGYHSASGHYGAGIEFLSGHLILNGGTISGNRMIADGTGGGGVKIDDDKTDDGKTPTFVMNGGTISGNEAAYGGGVYVRRGVFTLNGGTISGNTAHTTDGGGVHIYSGDATLNMTGGTISGNQAVCGGGIGVNGGGIVNISGGTISGNNASTAGGGLSNQRGAGNTNDLMTSISISGDPVITDNTVNESTTSNIYLVRHNGSTDIRLTIGELTDGAEMGVSLGIGTGVFTTGYSANNTADPNAYFFSDNGSYAVGFTGSEAQLTSPYTITWQNYDGTVLASQTLGIGSAPSYNGAVPAKADDAEHSYIFAGWNNAPAAVTSDATYTATFTALTKVDAVSATLLTSGNIEYYTGSDSKYYQKVGDNYNEITQAQTVAPALVNKSVTIDTTNDSIAAMPGNSNIVAQGYIGARFLGFQKAALAGEDIKSDSLRFVTEVSSEVLAMLNADENADYGYVFAALSTTSAATYAQLTIDNKKAHVYSCKHTTNTVAGEYGNDNYNSTDYKYVTAAINDVPNPAKLVARFYITYNGTTYYVNYAGTADTGVVFSTAEHLN